MTTSNDSEPATKPTTVRIPKDQSDKLAVIAKVSRLTQSAIISLAIDALTDFVDRTGKLPLPRAKRKTKASHG